MAAYCLGVGLGTLTLTATILTAVVFDEDIFDKLFGDSVNVNEEGVLITAAQSTKVTDGVPFTDDSVRRLLADEPMASPGACILDRTWKHREPRRTSGVYLWFPRDRGGLLMLLLG